MRLTSSEQVAPVSLLARAGDCDPEHTLHHLRRFAVLRRQQARKLLCDPLRRSLAQQGREQVRGFSLVLCCTNE
jgi:hypothetical protein